jgi:phage terminase large subunit-like protein
VQRGQVCVPAGAGWLDDYIDELEKFPSKAHDDRVDATSLAFQLLPADLDYVSGMMDAIGDYQDVLDY